MKILAFLQNQWFKKPDAVKAVFARNPDKRNELIKRLLFSGCVTGQRLREAFGSDLCNRIVWEEASPHVGGHSSAAFKADIEHIKNAITNHAPDLILCFGNIAGNAVRNLELTMPVLYGPHPAARGETVDALQNIARTIKLEIEK